MQIHSASHVYASEQGFTPICPRAHDFAVTEIVVHASGETRRLYPVPGGFVEFDPDEPAGVEASLERMDGNS
jgi:hypothetical protein